MKEFKVYYSIFGKKLMTRIKASSPYHAHRIVLGKVKFLKTELVEEKKEDDAVNRFKDIFGMK